VAARIFDDSNSIIGISNNYASISFNVGPTLMSWMEEHDPDAYEAILHADRLSRAAYSGHGSAIAQAYNHMIMPLANDRDRRTQAIWGKRDFESRFKRAPEGMWLAETAVNTASLEALAEQDIRYTILAPHQARRVRHMENDEWFDVGGSRVDGRRPYRVNLPSGRTIDVFFYDGPASRAVAFENLLSNGSVFAERLLSLHGRDGGLAHIATDGETYGHHHGHGEMALAFACRKIQLEGHAKLTNYGEYLERFPPEWEVEIEEDTSWSCAHGVRRWKEDCGCASGGQPHWHQRWRKPLREAFDWLRDQLADLYETRCKGLFEEPWAARDDYIEIILDRSPARVESFLERHAGRVLEPDEARSALQLLEIQRNAMLMYTSCGWFFDDISGVEGVQVMRYAARAIELASHHGAKLEAEMVDRLRVAEGNVDRYPNGRMVWESLVRPIKVELRDVVGHQAVMSLFEHGEPPDNIYCYQITTERFERRRAGLAQLVIGSAGVTSKITRASGSFCYAALHLGDHNLMGGVLRHPGEDELERLLVNIIASFERADLVATQRELDRHFRDYAFSLRSLFSDQRDYVIARILERPIAEAELAFRQLDERHAPLMSYLAALGLPQPDVLQVTARQVINQRLRRALELDAPDVDAVVIGCNSARARGIALDETGLAYAWRKALERCSARLAADPASTERLTLLARLAGQAAKMSFEIDMWRVQNTCWELLRTEYPREQRRADADNADARLWTETFHQLCSDVRIRLG
jgi:hypothetical protein